MFPFRDSVTHSGCGGGRVTRAKKNPAASFGRCRRSPPSGYFGCGHCTLSASWRPSLAARVPPGTSCGFWIRGNAPYRRQKRCRKADLGSGSISRRNGGGPYDPGTVAQYISDAKSVEKIDGNLDELYAKDCIAEVLQELEYAATARKQDSPNPKRLHGPGYKSAVNAYRKFCDWAAGRADARGFRDGG